MSNPRDRAQIGLSQIESAIIDLLKERPDGMTNSQIAVELGIASGEAGEHRNMLSWSILGRLIQDGKIERLSIGRRRLLRIPQD